MSWKTLTNKLFKKPENVYNNIEEDAENENEDEIENSDINIVAKLEFLLSDSGELEIVCSWQQSDSGTEPSDISTAIVYGKFLSMLNDGMFKHEIISALTETAKETKINSSAFVSYVLSVLESISNETPMKPSEAFKNVSISK